MNRLALGILLAAVVAVLSGFSSVAIAGQQAELSGTVTVNGESPPVGVGIIVRLEDRTGCGTTTTEEDGAYRLVLAQECPAGSVVLFSLAATGDRAVTEVTVQGGDQRVNITFEDLPPESLQAIGAIEAAVEEAAEEALTAAAEVALAEKIVPEPLIEDKLLLILLMTTVIAGIVLLALMVLAKVISDFRAGPATPGADEVTYRHQIEGMVLVMVIVAVILLGVTEKIGEEGLVSVLAAIAGYALGRAAATGA